MRAHRITVLQLHDDPTQYTTLLDVSYDYSGPVDECKKGRGQMEANMKADADAAAANRAKSNEQYSKVNTLENEEMASTTPGSLSPAAIARLASDRDNISRTYNGIRQTAFRTLGQRGFGSAPSGFGLAAENGTDLGQAQNETAAYRQAQLNTENQREHAMGTAAGLTGTEGSLGNSASGESTSAAVARNKAGSTFGDVMGGIGDIAGIAFPALGAAKTLGKTFSKIGSNGSGVGGYVPSDNSSGVG